MSHSDFCTFVLEDHVFYDKTVTAYRAQLRCPCGGNTKTSRKAHRRVMLAEREAREWRQQEEAKREIERTKEWMVRDV